MNNIEEQNKQIQQQFTNMVEEAAKDLYSVTGLNPDTVNKDTLPKKIEEFASKGYEIHQAWGYGLKCVMILRCEGEFVAGYYTELNMLSNEIKRTLIENKDELAKYVRKLKELV